ncbi:MAG: B12-binding domain-containing radical SAM protein [Proteobacteria bacterium]|nr:B12-binding domain-containing radical SAM protein [Pseudomonadota bacterium]MBU1740639.1 B12-binding domain-containing radical SAM protein [Pseudomonadota bacterium]
MSFRVILINPPMTREERYGRFAEGGSTSPPNGLLYIAAVLEGHGCRVRVLDGLREFMTAEDVLGEIEAFRPDLIGLTLATIAFYRAVSLARMIKDRRPETPIVVGGPDVSARLADYRAHLTDFPLDLAVYGEGEDTVVELVDALRDGGDLSSIKGLIHQVDGRTQVNPPRPFRTDLDGLPLPARHLLPNLQRYRPNLLTYKRRPWTTMITSRGCPNQCTFCDRSLFGQRYRARSAENVFAEMKHLHEKFGIREISFMDDTFTIQRRRVERLCDLLIESGLKVAWMCFARANTLNRKLLAKMRLAGCWMISLGIESGNAEILEVIKKGIDLDQVRRVCRWSNRLGIAIRGLFMLGLPTETKQSIERTIDFARSLNLYTADFCITYLLPNTELTRTAEDYGQVGKENFASLSGHTNGALSFIPHGFTQEELLDYQRRAYMSVLLRPRAALNVLRQVKGYADLAGLVGKLPVGLSVLKGLVFPGSRPAGPGCDPTGCATTSAGRPAGQATARSGR